MKTRRDGLLAAGNFIVDYVKVIDGYPREDMLASILRESQANGGGPYNVLKDLVGMEAGFPLSACGLVGEDANGAWIISDCAAHGIDVRQLHQTRVGPTSYTDAMTVESTGRRTFFHQRGANAHFDLEHCRLGESGAKIFHLGYLMLLDRLDEWVEGGQTRAAQLLGAARAAGMQTSVDMVSTEHPRFRQIALAALPVTDHLIINELEASRVLGKQVAADEAGELLIAASELLELGVAQSVTIHTEHGAVSVERSGAQGVQASLRLPAGFCQGATGAGDAFAAGFLYGLHEDLSLPERLRLAVCTAAASLSDPTPSKGLRPIAHCLDLAHRFGFGDFAAASIGVRSAPSD